jgi:cAMP phosphodiesterase
VKSAQAPWEKNCLLAVDAGVLASGVLDILTNQMLLDQQKSQIEKTDKKPSLLAKIYSNLFQTRQPQTQVQRNLRNKRESVSAASANHPIFPPEALPHERPVDNVWHIINNLLSAVCITHPHLDHVAGLVINSGNFNIFQPRTVVGLTSTIDSLLQYIFNGVIWPNLTNEGVDPVGLITLQRLRKAKPHQHSIATSDPTVAAKYSKHGLATNLSVLPFEVSHGTACQVAGRRHSSVAFMNGVHFGNAPSASTFSTCSNCSVNPHSPTNSSTNLARIPSSQSISTNSASSNAHTIVHNNIHLLASSPHNHPNLTHPSTYISTAYFITDSVTSRTVLIWGDVEPDIVSATPRNMPVWAHAAGLLSNNSLAAIFIECSYNSLHEDALLFGHFSPSHLVRELSVFASMCTTPAVQNLEGLTIVVTHVKDEDPLLWNTTVYHPNGSSSSRATEKGNDGGDNKNHHQTGSNIDQDETSPSHLILKELYTLAKTAGLLCTFELAIPGYSFTF